MKKKEMLNSLKLLSKTALTMLFFVACSNGDKDGSEDNFDRAILLENVATKLIIPNFESLQENVSELSDVVDIFVETTSEENLQEVRSSWVRSVIDFQHCSAFGFGPGELNLGSFATVLGVFPVDESQVEDNITNSTFNLAASFDRDVRGFYTVEYLIYGDEQSDDEIIDGFDQNRKDYLLLIVAELKNTLDVIVTEWKDDYLTEFTRNDGTSAGSPISLLYNEFVKDYEILKNFKVELPAGLSAGQSSADPTLVEAYYSGISKDLINEHFQSSRNIWEGRSRTGEDIIGFKEYLETVVGGPDLVERTKEAKAEIESAIVAIPAGQLSGNLESVEFRELRDLLQENTANIKSTMSSLLGISITFNSGDGD